MISKKDLLKEMNISYGQLYRWKREGLIPDDWFIKQSVSTGQETYFQKDLIINRIKKILELKDQYQLDELKEFLNPNSQEKKYTIRDLILIDDLDPFILKSYSKLKDVFSLIDVIIIYIFSKYKHLINYDKYSNNDIAKNITLNHKLYILSNNEQNYLLTVNDDSFIDNSLKIIEKINFEDIASEIAKKI